MNYQNRKLSRRRISCWYRTVYLSLVLVGFLMVLPQEAFAQNKLTVSTGMGEPELMHAGLHYDHGALLVGGSLGLMPFGSRGSHESANLDLGVRFQNMVEAGEQSPWLLKTSTTYWHKRSLRSHTRSVHQSLAVGYDLPFSDAAGVMFSGGFTVTLWHGHEAAPDPVSGLTVVDTGPVGRAVSPSAGVRVYYRLPGW